MKVFLMYRDRDFYSKQEPPPDQQVLSPEMERILRMHRDRDLGPKQELPSTQQALIQDLELGTLFEAMAQGDRFVYGVSREAVLIGLTDPDTIRYRQEILEDCLRNPAVVREIYSIPIQAIESKRHHWMGISSSYPSGILNSAIEMLAMFVALLKRLRGIADQHARRFESEGFRRFFAMIQEELTDDYFALVDDHLRRLAFRNGVLISGKPGKGNEGTDYVLRRPNHQGQPWMKRVTAKRSRVYSFRLDPRDEHGARALGEFVGMGINLVANAAAQAADHIDSFFNMLYTELAFYVGCMNLSEQLARLGEPIAFPEPVIAGERRHSFVGLYDVCLALTMKQQVVGNDVNANGKEFFIITGANQGGKSVFLRSIGLAQLMMQCGMFVPAESFCANVCTGLFTHYKREEDSTMESGKFDEELGRMSAIVDKIAPDCMVLFNESFAATNEREGSEIARQIVTALLERRIKVLYVTHLYELAHGFYGRGTANAIFLRAERQADGTRTFKLAEGEPLQTSFGPDLYRGIFAAPP